MTHTVIRRSTLCFLASVMLCATALGAQAQEVKERTLRFGLSLAKDHPMGVGAQKFADLVGQKSGGKIKISIFPSAV
ncbi:MAG TPA: hypothetical protein VFY72_02820, partial [Beijerinckiaceae bacterium]|nr:hypothetical protein [Beijerinckiaceae bacterium]